MTPPEPSSPRIWNIWWTLTVLAGAFTLVVALLEAFGVFGEVGLAFSIIGLLVTIGFGLSASTRSSVQALHSEVQVLHRALASMTESLRAMADGLGRIETLLRQRLP